MLTTPSAAPIQALLDVLNEPQPQHPTSEALTALYQRVEQLRQYADIHKLRHMRPFELAQIEQAAQLPHSTNEVVLLARQISTHFTQQIEETLKAIGSLYCAALRKGYTIAVITDKK